MAKIESIGLIYETLVPVENPDNTFLSCGTVSLLADIEINLDFNSTNTAKYVREDSYVILNTVLDEFESRTYDHEYQRLGLTADDLTYQFFSTVMKSAYVTDVFAEYLICGKEEPIPITLKKIYLSFDNGKAINYSDRISVFALADLAEVA